MKIERDAKYFLIGFIAVSIFFLLMGFVFSGHYKVVDYAVKNSLVTSHNTFSDELFLFFTNSFNNTAVFFLFLIAFTLLARQKLWKDGLLLGATLFVTYCIGYLFKLIVSRERPISTLLEETGFSFPSGHALKVTTFVLLFVFLYTESIPSFIGRRFLITGGWLVIFFVCLSRLYFVVHWFTDVFAGFLLGVGAFCFAAWFRIKYNHLF